MKISLRKQTSTNIFKYTFGNCAAHFWNVSMGIICTFIWQQSANVAFLGRLKGAQLGSMSGSAAYTYKKESAGD